MPSVLPSTNICQQTRSGQHTRNSKQKIRTSLNFSSHLTLILNKSQQNNYEAFSRTLRVHLFKYTTISLSKSPKSNFKLVTHMHYDNLFDHFITVVLSIIPKLVVVVSKSQYLVIPFCLGEGEPLPNFNLIDLVIKQARSTSSQENT